MRPKKPAAQRHAVAEEVTADLSKDKRRDE